MGLLMTPMCKAERHHFLQMPPKTPLSKQDIYWSLITKKECNSNNVIHMATAKTNSAYPTSIQNKIQRNSLLIRCVSASHFHKILCMNFCHMLAVEASQKEA